MGKTLKEQNRTEVYYQSPKGYKAHVDTIIYVYNGERNN